MGRDLRINIIRFILIGLLQVLVLKRIDISIGSFNYLHLVVYPLFILLIPIKTPRALLLLIAFAFGLLIDMFYNSPGVHAAATVLIAFIRPYVLKWIEPTEGYTNETTPTIFKMGITWFIIYGALLLFIHHLCYFSLEAFSYVYLLEILLRTIFSFIASFIIMMIIMVITNPKY